MRGSIYFVSRLGTIVIFRNGITGFKGNLTRNFVWFVDLNPEPFWIIVAPPRTSRF